MNLAKMTYVHESRHSYQYSHGNDASLDKYEVYAALAEGPKINNSTQARYIKQTNNFLIEKGYTGKLFQINYMNKIFNIIR